MWRWIGRQARQRQRAIDIDVLLPIIRQADSPEANTAWMLHILQDSAWQHIEEWEQVFPNLAASVRDLRERKKEDIVE